MPMIKQNDVIDVIYDSIYGYSLEEAFKILEDHRKGAYIPVDWIEKQKAERENYGDFNTAGAIGYLLLSWEKENESRKGEEEK